MFLQLVWCEQSHREISVFVNNTYTDGIILNSKQSRQNTQKAKKPKKKKKKKE